MNQIDARLAIHAYLFANFATIPSARIAIDNDSFERPTDTDPWAKLSLGWASSKQVSLRAPTGRHRHFGVMKMLILTEQRTGPLAGSTIAQEIVDLFRGQRIADDILFPAVYGTPADEQDDIWWPVSVTGRFWHDELA